MRIIDIYTLNGSVPAEGELDTHIIVPMGAKFCVIDAYITCTHTTELITFGYIPLNSANFEAVGKDKIIITSLPVRVVGNERININIQASQVVGSTTYYNLSFSFYDFS